MCERHKRKRRPIADVPLTIDHELDLSRSLLDVVAEREGTTREALVEASPVESTEDRRRRDLLVRLATKRLEAALESMLEVVRHTVKQESRESVRELGDALEVYDDAQAALKALRGAHAARDGVATGEGGSNL